MVQPNISLAVETPVTDPAESIGKVLSIRSMQQQQLLHGEQLKAAQIANQEHVKAQQDDTLNSQTWQQANGDPTKHIELFGKSGARPQAVQALQKHYKDLEKETAEIGVKDLEIRKDRNERFSALTQQAIAMPDDEYAAAWPQIKAAALAIHPEMKSKLPDQPIPKDALQHLGLGLITEKSILDRETERRAEAKRKEDAAAAARDAAKGPDELRKLKAEAGGAEATAAIKQFELDAAKATPEQQAAKVGASIDQAKYPEIYKRTLANVTNGVTHQDKMSALHAGSAEVAEREKETDPNIRKARVATAVATEQALTPLKIAQAVQTEIAKAKASGDAFGGIVDPVERHRAEGNYDAYSKEYLDKAGESRRLKDLIKSAQGGNKAAPGVIPIEELRSFVNRVNSQELKAVGPGAGSLMDQIQGKFGKLASGQPIPPDLLKDIGEIADLSEKAAERTYNFKLQILKQKGAKVGPIKPEDVFGAPTAAPIRARDPQGNLHEAPSGTALPAGWKEEK